MLKAGSLLIVGAGNMGGALLRGLLGTGWDPAAISVVERSAVRRDELSAVAGITVTDSPSPSEAVLLAVKPSDAEEACTALQWTGEHRRLLSIVAGVPSELLERWTHDAAVLRAMPNVAAAVGRSATALCAGRRAKDDDVAWAEGILAGIGTTVRVPESLMDAVTGLSGSGPAFLAVFVEAMIEAGVQLGLSRADAAKLATETVWGVGEMLVRSGQDPASLRYSVTSPGGTTAAGLQALEARAFRAAVAEAIGAAAERSAQLRDKGTGSGRAATNS